MEDDGPRASILIYFVRLFSSLKRQYSFKRFLLSRTNSKETVNKIDNSKQLKRVSKCKSNFGSLSYSVKIGYPVFKSPTFLFIFGLFSQRPKLTGLQNILDLSIADTNKLQKVINDMQYQWNLKTKSEILLWIPFGSLANFKLFFEVIRWEINFDVCPRKTKGFMPVKYINIFGQRNVQNANLEGIGLCNVQIKNKYLNNGN